MATVFKRREYRAIPEGAEIITYRGKRYAKWTNAKTGRAQRAPLNEAGNRIVQEAETYTAQYFNEDDKRRKKPTGCQDKDEALRYANHLENEARKRRTGQIDPTLERFAQQAQRPIAEHMADFRASLEAKEDTDKHVDMTNQRVRFIVEKCGATHIKHLAPSAVQQVIKGIRDAGRSLETCNSYLRAIKSFTRWLCRDKRTSDDALQTLEAYNAETDQRHLRRELTPEELAYLLPFVEGYTKPAHNLAGPDRAMVYRLALGTGFRANELRSLTPESFDLDVDPPAVTVAAAYSKRRRNDVQPIRADLADLLRPWLVERPQGKRLFSRLPRYTARMLKTDLAAARKQWIDDADTDTEKEERERSDFLRYEDSAGRFADFHSTRHTFISGIVATGATVKTAQELARHSDPRLTIGRYSHARLHDLQGALEALPDLQPQGREERAEAVAATGTDHASPIDAESKCGSKCGSSGAAKTCVQAANRGERSEDDNTPRDEQGEPRNVLPLRDLVAKKPRPEGRGEKRRARDSNPQLLTEHLISNEAASHSLTLQKWLSCE